MKIKALNISAALHRILFSVALGLLIACFVGPRVFHHKIELAVSDIANPAARGKEVWVRLLMPDGQDATDNLRPLNEAWSKKNGWWLSGGGGSLLLSRPTTPGTRLLFISHPWSGRVLIKHDRDTEEIDLYSPNDSSFEYALDYDLNYRAIILGMLVGIATFFSFPLFRKRLSHVTIEKTNTKDLAYFIFAPPLLASMLAVLWPTQLYQGLLAAGSYALAVGVQLAQGFLVSRVVKWTDEFVALSPATRRTCLISSAIVLCGALAWFSFFFPGLMSIDSSAAVEQTLGGPIQDMPAAHAIYLDLLRIGQQFWMAPLLQVLLLSLAFLLVSKEAMRFGVSGIGVYLSALLLISSPVAMVTIVTLWRDVPYALAVVFLTYFMMRIARERGDSLSSISVQLGISVVLASLLLFRFNGFVVATGVFLILFYLYWPQKKHIAKICLAVLILVAGAKLIVYPSYGVVSARMTSYLVAHHIAAHLKASNPLGSDDKEFLNSIRKIDSTSWAYDCSLVNRTVFTKEYDAIAADENIKKMVKIWISLAVKNPLVEFKHFVCASDLVWRIRGKYAKYVFAVDKQGPEYTYIWPNPYVVEASVLDKPHLQKLLGWLYSIDNPSLVRPAPYLYALLLIFLLGRMRKCRIPWSALTPVLLSSFSVALLAVAQDVRYQYPVFVISIILSPMLLLLSRRSQGGGAT